MSRQYDLSERLRDDLKQAQKERDAARVETLRFLLSLIHNRELEKRGGGGDPHLTDEEVTVLLRSETKRRREALELFRRGGREDLADAEEASVRHIEEYLPPLMDREKIEEAVHELKAAGFADFNSLMREAMQRLKGKADGRLVAEVVREKTK